MADEAELFFARQYQAQRFSEESWERMSREWANQRLHIQALLQAIVHDKRGQITDLDDALTIISEAGTLSLGLLPEGQQDLLRLMIDKVVLDPQGNILRVELRPPFGYMVELFAGHTGTPSNGGKSASRNRKSKTSSGYAAGSTFTPFVAPDRNRTCDPPLHIGAYFYALWTIPSPCRSAS